MQVFADFRRWRCKKHGANVGNAVVPAYDVMTTGVPELDWALLKRITARVTAEVPGICRVCYDLTPKPVGTVEWE